MRSSILLHTVVSLCSLKLVNGFLSPSAAASLSRTSRKLETMESAFALSPVVPDDLSLNGDIFTSSSQLLSNILVKNYQGQSASEAQFYFLFFAGSGAGGIGISQIPKIINELKLIRSLSWQGVSEGGNSISRSFLVSLLYPSDISEKDVLKAIAKLPSGDQINERGTSDSYVASKGYVVQSDFLEALQSCNPIASYALYQAVSKGKGRTVSPIEVDEAIALYKTEKGALTQFTKDFEASAFTKVSSYATLAFLLFVTFDLIIETGLVAFT